MRPSARWLLIAAAVLIGIRLIEVHAREDERRKVAYQQTEERLRATTETLLSLRHQRDSLLQLLAHRVQAWQQAQQRATQAAQHAALLASRLDSLEAALPPPAAEAIRAERLARQACEEQASTCQAVVRTLQAAQAAADSERVVWQQQRGLYEQERKRLSQALKKAQRPWSLVGYFGWGFGPSGTGWQLGIGLARTLWKP
jgi:hypothetical protein